MRTIRALSVLVFVVMLSAVSYGLISGSFGAEGSAIWALPWGKVTLVDLYAGLVIFGAWIAWREGSKGVVLAWWVALAVLGNLAAAGYLLRAAFGAGSPTELLIGRE